MATRFGSFALGFATGALTVVAYRRLREYTESEDYERLADSVQTHLQELEARIGAAKPEPVKRQKAGASKAKGRTA